MKLKKESLSVNNRQTDFLLVGNERMEFPYRTLSYSFQRFDDIEPANHNYNLLRGPSILISKWKFGLFKSVSEGEFIYLRNGKHRIQEGKYNISFSVVEKSQILEFRMKKPTQIYRLIMYRYP